MRIGLYGIYGTYNFGCEAIVRGAYKFLQNVYPGSDIIYFSYAYEYDCKMLSDLHVTIVPVNYTKSIVRKIKNRVLSCIDENRQLLMVDYKSMLEKVDVILSIGGDIYTIPEYLRNKGKYPYYNTLINFCDKAIDAGKIVIVYGGSVGPWGDYKPAVRYYSDAMMRYKQIICREFNSVQYLEKLGFKNVSFLPDPAFQIKQERDGDCEKKYLGVNLSPLSLREVFGNLDTDMFCSIAEILDKLYEKHGIEILLIPHVISKDEKDDDAHFLKCVREKMKQKDHAIIADYSSGFLGIKKQLRSCYMVLSARMHCAINAIVENVPAIFIAYSQKSIGMGKFIYGDEEYVCDLKRLESDIQWKVDRMLVNRSEIEQRLIRRNSEFDEMYKKGLKSLKGDR